MDALDDPDESILRPPWGQLGRAATLAAVSALGKLWLHVLNRTDVRNGDALMKAVYGREPGTGLITVSNHTSTTDDPAVLSAMMPWWHFASEPQHQRVRWTMCAREICFKNDLLRQFFLNGKTLPINRSCGVDQPIMHIAADLVRRGDWLHVFPEGRVKYTGRVGPCKHGIGKVVCDALKDGGRDPVVLPLYHSGMGDVQPKGSTVPRVGRRVTVTVGEPLDLRDVTCRCNDAGEDQRQVWRDIAARICSELRDLEGRSPPNTDQLGEAAAGQEHRQKPDTALPGQDVG